MNKEVKSIEEALVILKALGIAWITVNKIKNNLWDKGVAFYDRHYCLIAYYDEVNNVLLINL